MNYVKIELLNNRHKSTDMSMIFCLWAVKAMPTRKQEYH